MKIDKASKKINEKLDLLKMVKKFIQLERLTYLVLSNEPKIFFDNLPRPLLYSNIETSFESKTDLIPKALEDIINLSK